MRKRDHIYYVNIANIVYITNTLSTSTNRKNILIYYTNVSFITSEIPTTK